MATELTKDNFDQLTAKGTVLVDFWAAWCGPCRMLSPVIDELGEKYKDKALVAKVNVDEQPELAERFGVSAIPTVVCFSAGKAVQTLVGVQPPDVYESFLSK